MSRIISVNPYKASDIQRAISELKDYKKKLLGLSKAFAEAIEIRFDEILTEEAPAEAQGAWTHRTEDTSNGTTVIFEFNGAVEFIEFGTGIVGKQNHDGINEDWTQYLPPPYTGYESGHYINPITHEWRYVDKELGKWVVTTGQPADPFMFRSVTRLLEESADIARRVINQW